MKPPSLSKTVDALIGDEEQNGKQKKEKKEKKQRVGPEPTILRKINKTIAQTYLDLT